MSEQKTNNEFQFSPENMKKLETILAKYPAERKQSAMLPALDIAQRQNDNWLSVPAMDAVAKLLEVPYIKVYEVATFYTMFNLKPVGEHFIQLCRTTPCWLRGSDKLAKVCKDKLGLHNKGTTADNKFSLLEVECLGACVNAPVAQINDDYYEDLSPEIFTQLLDDLAQGKKPKHGPQVKRLNSAPEGGQTTLKEAV
jgi:NADH-quinone oxidoreductase E subunit